MLLRSVRCKARISAAHFSNVSITLVDVEQGVLRVEAAREGRAEKGIFRGGGPLIAWFEDPAGNVPSVIQQ